MSASTAGAALRTRLEGAARRAGVPIAILVRGRRAAAREPLDEIARRTFAERHLGGPTGTPDAVLLVAAPALRRSVIETGKGNAGIVPEIDARAVTGELKRRFDRSSAATDVARALGDAADRIATSILATEERRRPLVEDGRGDRVAAPGASQAGGPSTTDAQAGDPPAAPGPRRRMLPVAAGLAIMLVLVLGLRQRRRGHDEGEPPRG